MKQRLVIACLAAGLLSSCSTTGRYEVSSSSPRAPQIEKALQVSVIPVIDIQNTNMVEAVKIWAEQSQTHHPTRFEFRHAIVNPIHITQPNKQGGTSSVSQRPSTRPATVPKITVHRKKITSKRLLDEICGQAGYEWTILGRIIVIRPRSSVYQTQP